MDIDPLSQEADWHLAEQVFRSVITTYRNLFGAAPYPSSETNGDNHALSSIMEPIEDLPLDALSELTGAAVSRIAAHENILAGRTPLKLADWNVILYSLSGARTLREGVARCSECFEAIDWRCGRMELRVQNDTAMLELDAMRPHPASVSACLLDLFGLTEIHGLLSWLIGRGIEVEPAMLDHSPDHYAVLSLPPLPFRLELEGGWTGFAFDAAYLDFPVVRSAEELSARPRRSLLFSGQSEARKRNASEEIREMALRGLREQHMLPRFDQVVATTGQSEATLRRKLAREGTSYRQIRESCRRELAFDLLRRTSIPVEDIAARLDFCDSDAFRQAFRKWSGTTPSSYRRQAVAS